MNHRVVGLGRSGSASGGSASGVSASGVLPLASTVESTVAPKYEDFVPLAEGE